VALAVQHLDDANVMRGHASGMSFHALCRESQIHENTAAIQLYARFVDRFIPLRISTRFFFVPAAVILRADAVFVQFIAERADADAELFRGLGPVAAALFNGV
jgi:hypothetical protein